MTRFQRLALTAFICLEVLIFMGAVVRATGSGLGCPDWPTCYGCLVPPTDASQIDFAHLDIAKFQKKAALLGEDPATITIEVLRERFNPVETWIEYINRVSSFPLLIALCALGHAAFKQRLRSLRWLTLGAFGLFLANAVIGALVVKNLLKPNNITLHMALAILLLCVLVYLAWRGTESPWRLQFKAASNSVKGQTVPAFAIALTLFVLVVIEGIMGSQVREMTDHLAKIHLGELRSHWVTELEQTWVYLVHRSFSWLILAAAIWFGVAAKRALGHLRWLELSIIALVCAQMVLGIVLAHVGIVRTAQVLHIGLSSLLVSGLFLWLLGGRRAQAG